MGCSGFSASGQTFFQLQVVHQINDLHVTFAGLCTPIQCYEGGLASSDMDHLIRIATSSPTLQAALQYYRRHLGPLLEEPNVQIQS